MGEVLCDRVCQFPRCRHHRRGRCLVRHTSIRGVVGSSPIDGGGRGRVGREARRVTVPSWLYGRGVFVLVEV
jgi:hypothetical protein